MKVLLRGDIPLKVQAHAHGFPVLDGFPAPDTLTILLQCAHVCKSVDSMRDFACPSVKLLAPAAGARGRGDCWAYLPLGFSRPDWRAEQGRQVGGEERPWPPEQDEGACVCSRMVEVMANSY